jgi:sugar lactone lactonase YvrE
VADSLAGLVWKVDVRTGHVTVSVQDPSMKGSHPHGINGIKVQDGFLYYTNRGTSTLWRIPTDEENGIVPAGAQGTQVAQNTTGDDIVLDADGFIYVALGGPDNAIGLVDPRTGGMSVVAEKFNSTSSGLIGPTAWQFGRGATDRRSLYVTADGGNPESVLGTQGLSRIDVDDVAKVIVHWMGETRLLWSV